MQTIVIVGGGAGGLELATSLGNKLGKKKQAKVILVDKNRTHIWKPLLHELATGALDRSTDGVVYHAHSVRHHYQFQLGNMIGLDGAAKTISLAPLDDDKGNEILPERTLKYDTLVMAVGSVSNDFGTKGVADNCYYLDSHKQAERFHHAMLDQFMRVYQPGAAGKLKLAIVGGGATGVELSAELYHVSELMKMYDLSDEGTTQRPQVTLLEAGPRILPALPEKIATSARRELEKLGVKVMVNTRVIEADKNGFITADGSRVDAHLTVWAAGVKAPDFIPEQGFFEVNRIGQIMVKPSLQSTVDDSVFVIGDCCGCKQEDGSWVPPRAQSAHQMASQVYKNIMLQRQNKPLKDYVYSDYGSLVNLSNYSTVGSLMGNLSKGSMFIEGHLARMVYVSLYRMHQIAIHGWFGGAAVWMAHKIGNTVKPKMKLH
jgi:NADH dehydrogenase